MIDPIRGVVFAQHILSGPLDITVNVRVVDNGNISRMDSTTMTVRFQSSTDFPQVSTDADVHLLSEDQPINTLVTMVTATTVRQGLVGPMSYYLAAGNFEEVFQIHQRTGALTIKNPVDYETNKQFQLWVEARDSGSPPFSSYTKININTTDVNDNSPAFSQSVYRCEVFENSPGSKVCTVLAADLDEGINGALEYSIIHGNNKNAFTMNAVTGFIKTNQALDREKMPVYELTVQAKDKGDVPKMGTALVIVSILDRNDNAPRFLQIFFTQIPENSPIGSTVLQITSTDEDVGANAISTYTIIDKTGSLPFAVDKNSGYITVTRPLDRETTDRYIIKVNANDSAWSVNTDVTVYVTDVNDNAPVFSQLSYTASVPEPSAENVFIMQVSAIDLDLGLNGHIFFFIQPPSDFFRVNATTGEVKTKQPSSGTKSYSFTIVASDCGENPNHSESDVTVNVVPLNEHPPVFLPFRPLTSIPFNVEFGTKVLKLTVVDQDFYSNDTAEYSITGGNASSYFQIEQDSGWLFVSSPLYLSLNKFFTVLVTAKDNGIPPLSTQATVSFLITDENRYAPYFSASQVTFSVPENQPLGTVIGKVSAHDIDHGLNGLVHYSIVMGNKDAFFAIGNSTGLDGINCEDNSYGFEELSYMELPPLDPRNNVLSLEFATVQQNSLLLYNYGSREDSESEFLALEIVDGKVQLSYNLGNGTVRINTEQDIADGNFHTVTASRTGQAGYLKVDSCTDDKPDGFCFSSNEGVGNERTLDVGSNNMVFGGMKSIDPILRRPGQVRTDDFIGCVKNIRLNGVPLEPSQALISHNILDSCPRIHHACENEVCFNGAVCLDFWSFYLCQCTDGFTGPNCGTKISQDSALQLDGESYIDYVIKESYKRSQLVRNQLDSVTNEKKDDISAVEIKFMTRRKEGVLVHIQGHDGSTSVKMVDGKIHYISEDGLSGHVRSVFTEALLSEGQWHLLHLERDRLYTRLILDNKYIMNVTNHTHDFSEINVQSFSLGRIPPGHFRIANEPGFTGCIEYFKYNRKILPFTGFNELVLAQPSHPPVQIGCSSANNCFSSSCSEETSAIPCLSQPCMNGGTCTVLAVGEFYCICPSNFTGPLCESCMSALDRHAVCHKMDLEVPLWIIGVVVPVTVVLLLLVVVILFRLQTKKQSKTSKILAKDRQGTDNKAFNNDSPCVPIQAVPDASDKKPDIIKAEKKYMTTDEACVQHSNTGQHSMFRCNESELEYYEIESTSSIVLSDTDVIHLSRHTNNYGSKYKTWGEQTQVDLELPTCIDKDSINRNKHCAVTKPSPALPSPYTPRDRRQRSLRPAGVSLHITNLSNEGYHNKLAEPLYSQPIIGRKHVVENIGPPVGLSVEEVKKLNAPRARKQEPKRPPLKVTPRNAELPDWDPRLPAPCIDSSSDGKSHSSFTCSEFECERDPSFIRKRQCVYEQAIQCALSDYSEGVDAKTSSPYKDCHLYTSTEVDRCFNPPSLSRNCRWEGLLNLGLQFDRYAAVFEDLAELPIELENVSQLDSDRKSDQEEIF
ncbi:UNVERIFIED_CONTAM: hypothetical protein FKN15_015775 [Acipenser sinensis]